MSVISLHEAVAWLFAGFLMVAAYGDIRARIIPNRLCLALLALWPLDLWLGAGAAGTSGPALLKAMALSALGGLGVGAAIFVVGMVLFSRGGLGGGDVKLMTVVGMWAGPQLWLPFVVVTAMAGGVLALVVLALAIRASGFDREAWRRRTLPYGVAIACGGFYVAAILPRG